MNYQEYLEMNRYSLNTTKTYTDYFRLLQQYITEGITQDAINRFIHKHNHHVSRAFLYSYFKFLKNEGYKIDLEIPHIKGRKPKKPSQWFKIEEINYLINNSPMPYSLLIAILFEGGLRITEALSITRRDILGYESNEGIIISLKGRTRRIQILPNTLNALCHYTIQQQDLDTPIFNFDRFHAYYKLKKIIREIFPQKKRIYTHMFRISSATHLLKKGMDLRNIQTYLGHSSIVATARYTKITDEDVKEQWSKIMEG